MAVFEEYSVEESLPKFQKLLEEEKQTTDLNLMTPATNIHTPTDGAGVVLRKTDLEEAREAKWNRTRYVRLKAGTISGETRPRGFWAALKGLYSRATAGKTDAGRSVEDTFRLVKEDELYMTTEELLRSRAIATALVERFESSCQYAMAQKVKDHLDVIAAKINLAQHDMCRYITEDQAIDFMIQAERGVQVEFLRYYPEVLPQDVADRIRQCNADMLFDNYVVMFYSKDAAPVRLLEEAIDEDERHRRNDPILFGTIRGSRDLYYIADWVYKDDDLTLETVEKALGTIPTLKDERISESQYRIEEALHELKDRADQAVAEALDRGELIREDAMSAMGL